MINLIVTFFDFVANNLTKSARKIRERHLAAWANLTRPLKPTEEALQNETKNALNRTWIAIGNIDTNHYDRKSWWNEYHQVRNFNVN